MKWRPLTAPFFLLESETAQIGLVAICYGTLIALSHLGFEIIIFSGSSSPVRGFMVKFLVLLLTVGLGAVGYAQEKEIEIDGILYRCLPAGNGNGAGACATKAYGGPFTREESLRLCSGATSVAPADCAIAAYSGPFTKEESITLCQGAWSVGPSRCASLAYNGPFTKGETVELCSSPNATSATAECALQAYAGPYTKREAIDLCRGTASTQMSTLMGFESDVMKKVRLEELLKAANLKAIQNSEYK